MGQKDEAPSSDNDIMSGEFVFPNKDRYKGDYKSTGEGTIVRHGYGTHQTEAGTTYTGCWENDKMNGKGHLIFPSGAIYDGEFKDNFYKGVGSYTWPSGSVYKGTFVDGKLQGEGTFHDTQNQMWVGEFFYKAAPALKFKLNL